MAWTSAASIGILIVAFQSHFFFHQHPSSHILQEQANYAYKDTRLQGLTSLVEYDEGIEDKHGPDADR